MSVDFLKTIPQYIIPQHGLNALAALLANVTYPPVKDYIIQRFIKKYHVNMREALEEDPRAYTSFNDFFIRHLKPECRPIDSTPLISPVDGCVSEIGRINKGQLIQAKGRQYGVSELLACEAGVAQQFEQGHFATLYLSPKDYHRIHMPMDAKLLSMTYIPGALFSVQPTTARVVPKLFARNERLAVYFETDIGVMVMVLVGAAIVGAIGTSWGGDLPRSKSNRSYQYTDKAFKKADEMGYFKLGSTVIVLFANEKVQWDKRLQAGSTIQFGQPLGYCESP